MLLSSSLDTIRTVLKSLLFLIISLMNYKKKQYINNFMDWLPNHTLLHGKTKEEKVVLILLDNLKFLLYLNLKSLLDNAVDKKI